MTATPMKNRADNIIDLLNILRASNNPKNKLISKAEIFDYGKYVDDIRIKESGKLALMKNTYGYISVVKNTNKVTYAQPKYHGTIPYGLKFTWVV